MLLVLQRNGMFSIYNPQDQTFSYPKKGVKALVKDRKASSYTKIPVDCVLSDARLTEWKK